MSVKTLAVLLAGTVLATASAAVRADDDRDSPRVLKNGDVHDARDHAFRDRGADRRRQKEICTPLGGSLIPPSAVRSGALPQTEHA